MKSIWVLQDAKNGFSQVVEHALKEGPQTVTRHGRECVVILSSKEYHRMFKKEGRLIDFFRTSSLAGIDLPFRPDLIETTRWTRYPRKQRADKNLIGESRPNAFTMPDWLKKVLCRYRIKARRIPTADK